MTEGEVRYCTTPDGVRIAYCVTGEGPPLIALSAFIESFSAIHHLPEEDAFWKSVAQRHRLIRFDFRGVGLSQRADYPLSLDAVCLDIETVAAALHLRRFALWGSGFSGTVALTYAGTRADQISKLVLYGPARNVTDVFNEEALRAYATIWRTNPDIAAQLAGDLFSHRERSPEGGARLAKMYRESVDGPIGALILEVASRPGWDAAPHLALITAPTLVMHRRGDTVLPIAVGQAVAAAVPGARLLPLEGETHHHALENSAPVLDAMLSFLAEDDRKRRARKATPAAPGVTTVLFTDLVGHTEMMRRLGDERGRDVLREHERITRDLLKQHGGAEVKTMGDGFMASFTSVTKAMDCSIALQRAFESREGEPLHVRVGLNAGEPIEEDGDLFGSTVIMASRIAAKAGAGEILIPEPLRHLLTGKSYVYADRGETMLKGFEDAVRLYEVRWRE